MAHDFNNLLTVITSDVAGAFELPALQKRDAGIVLDDQNDRISLPGQALFLRAAKKPSR